MKEKKSSKKNTTPKIQVDLNTCIPGQELITRHGKSATYECRLHKKHYYGHKIKLENGWIESRTSDGFVFKNVAVRNPEEDEDIVEILPIEIESEQEIGES